MITFGDAIKAAKQGKRIARQGWNGKGLWVYYVPAAAQYNHYLALSDGHTVSTWAPSCSDTLADDWHIREDKPQRFVKKPIEVTAYQWKGHTPDSVLTPFTDASPKAVCCHCGELLSTHAWLIDQQSYVICPNDWIITGTEGEQYPCKPDIFADIYDLA